MRYGGTDKNTYHSHVKLYKQLLTPFAGKVITLVEIGI